MAAPQNPSTPPPANSGEPPVSSNKEAAVRNWIEGMVSKSPAAGTMDAWNGDLFDAIPLSGLRLTFAGGGRALCSYCVLPSVADEEGNWHLGAIATVIDDIGAAAIMSVVGEIKISVDFSISFFSRAKIGDEVEIDAKIVEDKGRLTAVAVEVRHKKTGRLVAIGRQWMSFSRAFRRTAISPEVARSLVGDSMHTSWRSPARSSEIACVLVGGRMCSVAASRTPVPCPGEHRCGFLSKLGHEDARACRRPPVLCRGFLHVGAMP